jgi:hypothetical protein
MVISSMPATQGSMCGIDMSGGYEIQQILNADMKKLAFIACTRLCRGRRKLLPCCCSLGIIQRCLIGGPLSAGRIRLTARCSPVRNERLAMKARTTPTPTQRAALYLKRVARLTGAKHVRGDSYRLRAGRRNFLVDPKFVCVISVAVQPRAFLLWGMWTCRAQKSLRLHYCNSRTIQDCLRSGDNSEDMHLRPMRRYSGAKTG